jgi:hypothetical protein
MPVMRLHYVRESTEVEWPWEVTGDPGSALEDWGNLIRERIDNYKLLLASDFNATVDPWVVVSDLAVYVDVTFPDQARMDAYGDFVNTDPDWMPSIPSTFGLKKTVEVDPA